MHPAQEIAIKIKKAAEEQLLGSPFFVLDVTVSSTKVGRIRMVVDGDRAVTIDDCAEISRELNQRIGGLGILEDYHLEITTPGVDQSLKSARQYPKHIGRNLKVDLKDGRTVTGKLMAVSQDGIHLELEKTKNKTKNNNKAEVTETMELPFENMNKTFVLISFK